MLAASELTVLGILAAYVLLLAFFTRDAISRRDIGDNEKTFWILLMYLMSFAGILLYVLAKAFKYYRMGGEEAQP